MKKWAYYNEHDKNAAAWIRELIKHGHVAPGEVDERSIVDVHPDDVRGFAQAHWFAGIAVWSHALRLAGWADDRPIWTGSCPCQPFSAAGKGGGFDDERHLWPAFHHLIAQCRPDVVVGEQVASKDGLGWLDLVHADLEGTGYAVGAVDTCAAGFGAPHIRQRLWWVGARLADADDQGLEGRQLQRERAGERAAGPGGVASRLADALNPLGRSELSAGHDAAGPDAGRPQDSGDAGAGRGLCGLADGDSQRLDRQQVLVQPRRPQQARAEVAGSGGFDAMGLPLPPRGQPHPNPAPEPGADHADGLDDDHGDRPGQAVGGLHIGRPQSDGSELRPGPVNGFWGVADWLHCRDGRWRAVEPGTFPLVDGAPARVGRLRGYGNAIVAPAAEGFITAVMEAVS